MANQYKNKIIYNGESLIDLTSDTVSAATLLNGETAHDKSGAPIVGTYVPEISAFVITISWDAEDEIWTPDCTFTQAQTAYSEGRQIVIEVNTDEAIEDVQVSWCYYDTNSNYFLYVVTIATDSGDKHITYFWNSNGLIVDDEWEFYEAPTGNINITQAGVTDVTNYATATVAQGEVYADANSGFYKENGVDKWHFQPRADVEVGDYRGTPGYIPNFYYTTGADHVFDALPSTTVTPSTVAQTIGGANYMMKGAVTVAAMPSGSATAPASISGSSASFDGGTNALTFTKTISVTPEVTAGYVSSGTSRNVTVSLSADIPLRGQNDLTFANGRVTYPAGFYEQSGYRDLPTGVTTSPTSISGTAATVSTGTNTLTLTKTISVTPRVTTAGYVSAGTAGNSSVSLTANVTTKAAATITPGTSNQTIASGTYLTGTQTISGDADLVAGNIKTGVNIFGVAGSYTADATAAADDILSGQTAYVNGTKLTGTLEVQNFYTGSSTPAANFGNNGDLYLQVTT